MATSGYDGAAHYFRGIVVATPSSLGNSGLDLFPPIGKQPPFNPVPPDPNGRSGYPGTKPLPFLGPGPNPDGPNNGSYSPPEEGSRHPTTDSDSASGMTSKQEGDMFGQLLGGGN
jgi:phospholipid/cholesterol/gamma-HCH transport system substrate-binding protein